MYALRPESNTCSQPSLLNFTPSSLRGTPIDLPVCDSGQGAPAQSPPQIHSKKVTRSLTTNKLLGRSLTLARANDSVLVMSYTMMAAAAPR